MIETVMVYLNGSDRSFRCVHPVGDDGELCGCNVFVRESDSFGETFTCNACRSEYEETPPPSLART